MTDPVATNSNRLIEAYRSYSHAISAETLTKLPSSVDREDIIGAAELGLVQAAQSFDPSRGVLFQTFAYYRIRGAIYDALRKTGWIEREARLRFEVGAAEYLLAYYIVSFDGATLEVADSNSASPEDALLRGEVHQQLQNALAQLPDTNRRLIEQYYFQDATLEQIGRRLGLSKSWVCRLHARSLAMLRALMKHTGALRSRPLR